MSSALILLMGLFFIWLVATKRAGAVWDAIAKPPA